MESTDCQKFPHWSVPIADHCVKYCLVLVLYVAAMLLWYKYSNRVHCGQLDHYNQFFLFTLHTSQNPCFCIYVGKAEAPKQLAGKMAFDKSLNARMTIELHGLIHPQCGIANYSNCIELKHLLRYGNTTIYENITTYEWDPFTEFHSKRVTVTDWLTDWVLAEVTRSSCSSSARSRGFKCCLIPPSTPSGVIEQSLSNAPDIVSADRFHPLD